MEQPSLFQAAGIYAGDIELVANFQGAAKRHANAGKPRDAASVTMSKFKV